MNINNCLKEKLLNEIFRKIQSIIISSLIRNSYVRKTRIVFSIISIEYL